MKGKERRRSSSSIQSMEKKSIKVLLFLVLLLIFSVTTFRCCSAAFASKQEQNNKKLTSPLLAASDNRIGSSTVFLIRGNVYPDGYYYVDLKIGNPPKPYYLDIDTGSDLTWLNCDAPCVRCPKVPHPLYRPKKNYVVSCQDPVCAAIQPESLKCDKPNDQCDYEVEYADQASSLGVLVKDVFPLRFTNGTILGPQLAFGCGYDQQDSNVSPSPTDGVLGLGNGRASIVYQLQSLGLIRNVIGHCFSSRGGGFLFFGDDLVPSTGVTWTPMSRKPLQENYYAPGPADLVFGKPYTGAKGLLVVFDSGSSYTYFNSQAYEALISFINKDLNGKPLKRVADETLPVCWKGSKPFKSMRDVKKYFKPLLLSFLDGKRAQLEISPESYLIISSHSNVCLGILNGTEIGLQNLNIIGDIFFLDKVVIYDNEKQQIGWASADCSRLPNIDREYEEGFSQPFAITDMGVLPEELCPASHEDDHERWF